MLKYLEVHWKGVAPLIINSVRKADPLNPICQKMKAISGKRKKTEQDYIDLGNLEYLGGLETDDEDRPIVKAVWIEACIRDGAKKTRKGKDVTAGLMVDDDTRILYKGPKTGEKLVLDSNFRLYCPVVVQRARIMRTRPMFKSWEIKFTLNYNTELLNEKDIVQYMETASLQVGFCDYRPRYGRFKVVSCVSISDEAAERMRNEEPANTI